MSEAWAHACDALQLDSTDKNAIALEARIRKALEAQAARDFAREQEQTRRAHEARAREIERADALARSRMAIENSLASGDVDNAEQELRRADESFNPGAEFADLRARVLELRREAALRQDRLAEQARAREVERANTLARSRMAIENSLASGDLDNAEQELRRADEAFNPGAEFADLRARVLELRRQAALREERLAEQVIEKDLRRDQVVKQEVRRDQVVEQDLRREQGSPSSQPQAVRSIVGHPRLLWAAAALFVVAGAALWLVPLALNKSPQPPPKSVAAPATDVTGRTESIPAASASSAPPPAPAVTAPAPAVTAPAGPETAPVQPGPSAAEPATSTAPPDTAAEPPAATAGAASPTTVTVPNETIVANFLRHVQTLLAKKEPELALSVLTDALAYAPADKGLRAMGPKILEQAQARARQERSKALAKGASARPKFKQADRTMQSALALSRDRKTEASARAYFDAADLFAASAPGTAASGAARGNEDVDVPEAAAVAEPEPPPVVPPAKTEPPPAARLKPTLAMLDPVIDGYASAMSRGDRGALLQVYPNPPADVLAALAKRPRGYNMRIDNRFMISDSRGRPEVVLSVVHESITASGAKEEKPQRGVLTLDFVGGSWQIVASRWS